jgi:flagellar motor component MotA
MKVYNKMKWALGILLVFIIVLITNLLPGTSLMAIFRFQASPTVFQKN